MNRKNALAILLITALAAVVPAGCAAEPPMPGPGSFYDPGPESFSLDIGQGDTAFFFQMTDSNGETTTWNVHTDEATVGAALLGAGLIEGDESEFGLMVTHVNGLRADYEKDGAYWAFYIDGEFAMTGADSTDIEQGQVYAFVYTAA